MRLPEGSWTLLSQFCEQVGAEPDEIISASTLLVTLLMKDAVLSRGNLIHARRIEEGLKVLDPRDIELFFRSLQKG